MSRQKTYLRYSEHFKQEVVRQIEKGEQSVLSAKRKYGIGGNATIYRWLGKYGNPNFRSTKIVIMKVNERNKEKEQAHRIKELEKALVNLQLKHLESEAQLELACRELGVDKEAFKKKGDPPRSK